MIWTNLLTLLAAGCLSCTATKPVMVAASDAGSAKDLTMVDAPQDSASATDAAADAPIDSADTVVMVTFGELVCTNMAKAACDQVPTACCGGTTPAGCVDKLRTLCLKLGYGALDTEIVDAGAGPTPPAGLAITDTLTFAANAAAASAMKTCDQQALIRAFKEHFQALIDSAEIGSPCHFAIDLACAKGKGRCDPKTSDVYVCASAVGEGDSCKLTQPCQLGLTCANTALTRATVCAKPGTTCQLSDTCWDGFVCAGGNCVAENVTVPVSCTMDSACPGTMNCTNGKCVPKLCAGHKQP